jgi:hypothetical protein
MIVFDNLSGRRFPTKPSRLFQTRLTQPIPQRLVFQQADHSFRKRLHIIGAHQESGIAHHLRETRIVRCHHWRTARQRFERW